MKRVQLLLIAIAVLLCFFSCKKQSLEPITETETKLFHLGQAGWTSNTITQTFPNIAYKATLVPLQYYILKQEGTATLNKIDSMYAILKNERVVEMQFEHETKDDLLKGKYTKRDYDASVTYMAFKIQNDFTVVTQSGDTIDCSGVTFERNFKIAPFKRVLLHFGTVPEDAQIQLLYNDKLFGNGLMKFKFKEIPILL